MAGKGWFSRIGKGGEGFMGKFGTGEGKMRDTFKLKPQPGYGGRGDAPRPGDTGLMSEPNPYSQDTRRLDTGNIDFGDEDQVKEIQRSIGVKDDGIWGQKTEDAYRGAIDKRRKSEGLLGYSYDEEAEEINPMDMIDPTKDAYTQSQSEYNQGEDPIMMRNAQSLPAVNTQPDVDYTGGDVDYTGASDPTEGYNQHAEDERNRLRDYWSNIWGGGSE